MRYTEYHAGKAVIKDRRLLPGAMEKLAKIENMDRIPRVCCEEYCKHPEQCRSQDEMNEICAGCKAGAAIRAVDGIVFRGQRPSIRVQRGSSPRTDRFDSGWCMVQNPELKGERK